MTKAELLERLKDVPDSAIIYIEADHGQWPQQTDLLSVTTESNLTWDGNEIDWTELSLYEIANKGLSSITAILIR